MKQKKQKLALLVMILCLITACGGGDGTGVNPDPDPDPDPDPPAGISFDTGNIAAGNSSSITFDKTGSVDYICTIHTTMKGSVTVQDNASTNDVTVTIENFTFSPKDITIGPGTKVTWVNNDVTTHTATSQ